MGENYYELLGVSRDASTDEIESAYREKLKETHPDVSDEEDASERTKRLIDAKETLTDETERQKYNRLGHENYVGQADVTGYGTTSTSSSSATQSTGRSSRNTNTTTGGTQGETSTSTGTTSTTSTSTTSTGSTNGTATGGNSGTTYQSQSRAPEDSWHDRARRDRDRQDTGSWRAWTTDQAYSVDRNETTQRLGGALRSRRALGLLGITFFVYPILLFGALGSVFPLPVNILVGMCILLVVAFLQSIPEVGIVVFGIWTLLLPVLMFGLFGLDYLTFRTLGALTAVVFPLGLSVLTRVAIRPVTAG